MRYLLPILNLTIAIAVFFAFTDRMVVGAPLQEQEVIKESTGGIRALLTRQKQLNDAIDTADQVGQKLDSLIKRYNQFDPADLARLDQLMPSYSDNIQLIIDVNGIARRNGMLIKDAKVSTSEDNRATTGQGAEVSNRSQKVTAPDNRLGVMNLSFTVTGSYETYKKFLSDLANSLRIIDISSASFATTDTGIYSYSVNLKTYWLK